MRGLSGTARAESLRRVSKDGLPFATGPRQDTHYAKMEDLVREMWATPALTPEGRRAKVLVALRMLPSHWREVDEKTEYGILETRQLLIEFVGGEPGKMLRDQFGPPLQTASI